ncbi:MAG: restriction endonuclease [Bacteroidetes bacterium]|nr:restriction endonuclease [Bacteroidota bacterium]
MSRIVEIAIAAVQNSQSSYCKFISANDVGKTKSGDTRSHQSGFYVPISFCSQIFETEINKGKDYVQFVSVEWQDAFTTASRFKFYGSKDECHFTRFGKGFPFLNDDSLGNLLIVCKIDRENYKAFILNNDDDFEEFFAAVNITANETNRPINKVETVTAEDKLLRCFYGFIKFLNKEFPSTISLANNARDCYNACYNVTEKLIKSDPDNNLLKWLDAEYQLFKAIESEVYSEIILKPFANLEELIIFANTLLNRRKSRAGKSLEYHLEEVFKTFRLNYTSQGITEENKKPDFIFPNIKAYHDKSFDSNKLILLASKTTCKDRWRQVATEANRIPVKHLFTLQQGVSENQLKEMESEGVKLVVPQPYLKSFPKDYRHKIMTLESFLKFAASTQN